MGDRPDVGDRVLVSVATRYHGANTRRAILAGHEPPALTRHPRAGYLRQAYLSVPEWLDRAELGWLDWCRRAWSAATGVEHVLDHDIPLNHPHVCGLTVPENMRLVPRAVNATKGGKWNPHQGALL